jgi:hypothetical protein
LGADSIQVDKEQTVNLGKDGSSWDYGTYQVKLDGQDLEH